MLTAMKKWCYKQYELHTYHLLVWHCFDILVDATDKKWCHKKHELHKQHLLAWNSYTNTNLICLHAPPKRSTLQEMWSFKIQYTEYACNWAHALKQGKCRPQHLRKFWWKPPTMKTTLRSSISKTVYQYRKENGTRRERG